MAKILVTDDDYDVLTSIKNVLELDGHEVEVATSGQECLAKLKESMVELVFLDVMMPGMDGQEVAKNIRQFYDHNTKIFFVSILPRVEVDLEQVDGFIQKPFTIEDVKQAAKRL